MYFLTILSALICIQVTIIASSDSNDVNRHLLLPSEATIDNENVLNSNTESDEDNDYNRRSTFLRFGRQMPSTGSFLRFGRSNPPSFLRFGRNGHNNGASFLRFGRRAEQGSTNNFLRFGRKGEFLRFG